ncbi:MAG: gliding motility-associated ABC transporter substrate-binding protein GldG [Bacteroidetes bacterium]|nr:MAG: gliding motility-associated ABC transporter substrate-binding protein GldG [Bacteroidota bacterium]
MSKKEKKEIVQKLNVRSTNVKSLLFSLVIIIALNMIGSRYFVRLDLTSEKRFTLTPATRLLLSELDDYVHFQVYLEGDFPAGFKRLRNQTREMLDELRAWSDFVTYEFINPTIAGDWERTEENYSMLVRKGLQPTQLQVTREDASSQQIIFPGAIARYRGREVSISLLQEQMGMSSENVINNSTQALEFNLASAIHKLTLEQKPRVAFLEGNGELEYRYVADVTFSLEDFYEVDRVVINGNPRALTGVSTLVVAQPLEGFTEQDKFVIDQFVMHGGSVLWLVDPVFASMDSLQMAPETLGMAWPLNLDDMLFRYGVRLNADLIMDMQSAPIPITTGFMGDRPQISMIPWFYFPLVMPASNHPMVRNLNAVRTEFVSTIDTVAAEGIEKTFLLQSSPYTRVVQTPARISFDIMERSVDERMYRDGPKPVAVLLEGEFSSLYTNRRSPLTELPAGFQRRDKGERTAMIVVSDGDIIRNQFDNRGQPLPLGYDRFLEETFGNADFILNAINYLNDDRGIMESRAREVRLRVLDRSRVNQHKFKLQLLNVALPVVLLLLFGFLRFYIRKRKYSKRIV